MNPVTATCVKISAELPKDNRQIRRSRTGCRSRSVSSSPAGAHRSLHEQGRGEHGAEQAEGRERDERRLRSRVVGDRRDGQGRREAADRDRGLADPERETAFLPREPACHDAAAGRVDRSPRMHRDSVSATTSPAEPGGVPRGGEPHARAEQADRARHPVSDPVGRHPPRQQRQRRPDARHGEHHADLGEAQVVAVAKRGREHGQPAESGRLRRLRDRPGREDDASAALTRGAAGTRAGSSCPRSGSSSRGTPSRPPCAGAPRSPCPRG